MPQLFSLNFDFQSKTYTAIISVRQQGHDLQCFIRYMSKALQYILAGDGFVFSMSEGLKQPKQLPNELAQNLVACTTEALTNYLQVEENY